MKVKRIVIEIELEKHDIPSHATRFTFENGMWLPNAEFYSRLSPALHAVWQTLRQAVKGDGPEAKYVHPN